MSVFPLSVSKRPNRSVYRRRTSVLSNLRPTPWSVSEGGTMSGPLPVVVIPFSYLGRVTLEREDPFLMFGTVGVSCVLLADIDPFLIIFV